MAKKKLAKGAARKVKNEHKPAGDTDNKKKNTSLRLDKRTLKALKIRAVEQETSIQNLIENLIRNYLDERN